MGRPPKGSLSSYPAAVSQAVKQLRKNHPGWGAHSILLELKERYGYTSDQLPGTASINRYLKEQGFVQARDKIRPLPKSNEKRCGKARRAHGQWEMDAKGARLVEGIGACAPINIKDIKSKVHCISFPVPLSHTRCQPKTIYYYWSLRIAFEQWGLPRSIRVDHDTVFYEQRTASPFPKAIHLWLLSLGVELCFIQNKPPIENAMVERSHQTIDKQIYKGRHYKSWKALFLYSNQRIEKLNKKLPNRMLNNKAPLEKFPKAIHSGRSYSIEQEQLCMELKKVYRYLAKGEWFRKVSKDKAIWLGGKVYYIKQAQPHSQIRITFCNRRKKLMFHDVNELLLATLPLKDLTCRSLMGAATKDLIVMRRKIFFRRNCPLIT